MKWCAYRKKRGTLHVGMRLDTGFALLASMYANTHSQTKHRLSDFTPYHDEPEIDLDTAMETWT